MNKVRLDPEELLNDLDPDQRRVAVQTRGPVCIQAGAGTGKTRAITYRIAYGVLIGDYQPAQVLAVTFTARAAAEMRSRLNTLGVSGVQARTFHAAALRQLSYFWPTVVGGPFPKVIEYKGSMMLAVAKRLGLPDDKTAVRDYCSEAEWAAVSMLNPADYLAHVHRLGHTPPAGLSVEQTAKMLEQYLVVKQERNVIDFEDVLALTAGMLEDRPDIAQQVRAQYKHFLVDEYQDISALQKCLLDQWLGTHNRNLCVVGDTAQTIYSFAGADPKYILNFQKEYPGATKLVLNRDYRSTPQIVALANQIVQKDPVTKKDAVHLKSMRESGPGVEYHSYADDIAEAQATAKKISELLKTGTKPAEIAILFRTNLQSQAFEDELGALQIPYTVKGGKSFYQRDEVRNFLRRLNTLAKTPGLAHLEDWSSGVMEMARGLGWSQQKPDLTGAVLERWESLNLLINLAIEKQVAGLSLTQFVVELNEHASAQTIPVETGVTLASIHSAKGLEWETVFLVGASEGLLPINQAKTVEQIAEECRLTYVAVTRAKRKLYISYARKRSVHRKDQRQCSRFLKTNWPKTDSGVNGESGQGSGNQMGTGSKRSGGQVLRGNNPRGEKKTRQLTKEFLEQISPDQLALFESLRAWRWEVSQRREVPAYTVLSDATLRDLVLYPPMDLDGLETCRGIGPAKLRLFGQAILAILQGATLAEALDRTQLENPEE